MVKTQPNSFPNEFSTLISDYCAFTRVGIRKGRATPLATGRCARERDRYRCARAARFWFRRIFAAKLTVTFDELTRIS
ncbi:unnamed protein product [Leptosia nina]|uniref:Uncharacterized protein n=1 Tax=Leptosia nina TaxID=320188 RepID=A0AAV1JRE3_9NEOP